MTKFRQLPRKYYFEHIGKFSQYSNTGGWAKWYSKVAPLKGKRVAKVLLNYKNANSKLLDLGCGTGLTLAFLAQVFPNSTGCDVGAKEVVATKTILKDHGLKIPLIKYNGKKLPFADSFFDIVTFIEVIEHVDNPDMVLKEIERVLKPDGVLHITTANKWWPIEPHFKLPFLSYLPKKMADWYVSVFKRGSSYQNIKLPSYSQFFKMVNKHFEVKDITLEVIADYEKFGLAKERGQAIALLGRTLKILNRFELIKKILVRFSLGWLFICRPIKGIQTHPVQKTIDLYSRLGWKSIFAKMRFWDAPFIEVEKIITKEGLILDLGCGEGIFTNYLALSSTRRKVVGIEIDKKRIKEADRGLSNVVYKYSDVLKEPLPKSDCIILFHLLHHLSSYANQKLLIEKCNKALKTNGKIVIVEVDKNISIKYLISWFTDHFIVAWLFENRFYNKDIYFRKIQNWKKLLRENGLSYNTYRCSKGEPFSSFILECYRK